MVADEWGRDPGVQRMRSVFGKIEEVQSGFLRDAELSPLDKRLKDWRRQALKSFEHHWGRVVRKGMDLSDNEVAVLYVACLAHVIQRSGVKIPTSAFPKDKKILRLMETDSK